MIDKARSALCYSWRAGSMPSMSDVASCVCRPLTLSANDKEHVGKACGFHLVGGLVGVRDHLDDFVNKC